jgi:uncharacterized protein YbjT (DUF2867 family)
MPVDRPTRPAHQLVVAGGSSGTGALVASLARTQGCTVRVVDAPERTCSLPTVIARARGVVIVPARGVTSVAAQVQAVLAACPAAGDVPHVVLITGFSVGHGLAHRLNTPSRLEDLQTAEDLVQRSGRRYTIVRPTWLTSDPPGGYAITLTQDPLADGMIARADLARVCLAAIDEPAARGRTFAVFAEPGQAPTRWACMFSALAPDDLPRR